MTHSRRDDDVSARPSDSPEAGEFAVAGYLPWPSSISALGAKLAVAKQVAARAESGDVVGIGSGTAAYLVLRELARRRQRADLEFSVVASSIEIEMAASEWGVPIRPLGHATTQWIVDGADEVDSHGRALKGRGGALFKEKLLWQTTENHVLVIDPSKRVETLGTRFPVPIEVHRNSVPLLLERLRPLGCVQAQLRTGSGKDGPVITETGFLIIDARFESVFPGLHGELKGLAGVLETGVFEGYHPEVICSQLDAADV